MTRAESVHGSRSLRAMVPMSVIDSELEPTSLGSQVAGHLLNLPIGEPSPVVRLHQVSYALKAHKETGRAVAADRLAGVAGFAPTTFHALGSGWRPPSAPRLQPGGHQRPRPAVPAVRRGRADAETYPVQPLLPGTRWRSASRRTTAGCTSAHRRPGRAARPRRARPVRQRGARGAGGHVSRAGSAPRAARVTRDVYVPARRPLRGRSAGRRVAGRPALAGDAVAVDATPRASRYVADAAASRGARRADGRGRAVDVDAGRPTVARCGECADAADVAASRDATLPRP